MYLRSKYTSILLELSTQSLSSETFQNIRVTLCMSACFPNGHLRNIVYNAIMRFRQSGSRGDYLRLLPILVMQHS